MSTLDGYHLASSAIHCGELGETSKIQEELDELVDALAQNCRIMALLEISDLLGAIELHIEKYYPGFTLEDVVQMQRITKRAFLNGARS